MYPGKPGNRMNWLSIYLMENVYTPKGNKKFFFSVDRKKEKKAANGAAFLG